MEEVKKETTEERKYSRFERRLQKRKQAELDKLVMDYFVLRSALSDPEGQEADDLYVKNRELWFARCKAFNLTRTPFKLKYEAFGDAVEYYIKMEKQNKAKSEAINNLNDFNHWFRRSNLWLSKLFFRALWYTVKTSGNKEKYKAMWKTYYVKYILDGTN